MALAVELSGITKSFGPLVANDHVDLQVAHGTIHALLGENGAGKSTLMNILYGMIRPDEGEIRLDGEVQDFKGPSDAIAARIGMVHQHFMIAPSMTVVENILVGRVPTSLGLVNRRKSNATVADAARRFGFTVDPRARAADLSIGELQRVEIIKALIREARTLILDEPTAVLTPQEADDLAVTLRGLASEGVTVLLITHKLREVLNGCDRATVMRGGRVVGSVDVAETDELELTKMMVGRIPVSAWPKADVAPAPLLAIDGVRVLDDRGRTAVCDVSLDVPVGRIVGIAGVEGNGQSQLVEAIAGLRPVESGRITVADHDITNASPRQVRRRGVAHVPEDRSRRGVAARATVRDNLIVNVYRHRPHSRFGLLRRRGSDRYARELIRQYSIAVEGPSSIVGRLSGGNMQKVVVARELATQPRVVIAAQPTRGVDVGSIEFIHRALARLRDEGVAVLLISAELDELRTLSDVIHVMYQGAVAGTFDPATASEYEIGIAMAGGSREDPATRATRS
jgi:simple sugar transport system ATP-binding protein